MIAIKKYYIYYLIYFLLLCGRIHLVSKTPNFFLYFKTDPMFSVF